MFIFNLHFLFPQYLFTSVIYIVFMDFFKSKVVETLKKYNSILIVGPLPPPIGGISVHVNRLQKALNNSEVFNIYRYNDINVLYNLTKRILKNNYEVVHVHVYDVKILSLIFLLKIFKKYKIILTGHNSRVFDIVNGLNKTLLKRFIENSDMLIVVGEPVLEHYKKNKIKIPKSVIVESAFLPPDKKEEKKILKKYPEKLFDFLNTHKPILSSNAFRLDFYRGQDLYGLDLCIDLTYRLKKYFENIGFIFAIGKEDYNKKYFDKMKKKIKELNLEKNFFFLEGSKQYWPIIKRSDIIFRCTNTDGGNSLTVKEALYFKKKVIASDAVKRPKGVIIFKNRDINDLYKKTILTIKELNLKN